MPRSFDEFERRTGGTDGSCPRCGENDKAGAVSIRLYEFKEGNASRYSQLASRQISMCEECAIEVYEELVADLNKEAKGGTRAPRADKPASARTRPAATPASTKRATTRRRSR